MMADFEAETIGVENPVDSNGRASRIIQLGSKWGGRVGAMVMLGRVTLGCGYNEASSIPTATDSPTFTPPAPTEVYSDLTATPEPTSTSALPTETASPTRTLTPTREPKEAEGDECVRRQVQPGDSLWKIAKEYLGSGTRWQEIAELNALAEGSTIIHSGDWLEICDDVLSPTPSYLSPTVRFELTPPPVPTEEATPDPNALFNYEQARISMKEELPPRAWNQEVLKRVDELDDWDPDPEVVERIVHNTVRIYIIEPEGEEAYFCNGVHVGHGKVATASHCSDYKKPASNYIIAKTALGNNYYNTTHVTWSDSIDGMALSIVELRHEGGVSMRPTADLEIGDYLFSVSLDQEGNQTIKEWVYAGGVIAREGVDVHDPRDTANRIGFEVVGKQTSVKGESGSGVFDINGNYVGMHLISRKEELKFGILDSGDPIWGSKKMRSEWVSDLAYYSWEYDPLE
jgi:hypothetical protein